MIAIGADHGGYALKNSIKAMLESKGIAVKDFGCFTGESCDYPDIAVPVCESVAKKECRLGVLVCGTGIGMSMAANKMQGIRAACCSDYFSAKLTRLHNDANILCLGARVVGAGLAEELVDVFVHAEFEGERHAGRVEKVMKLER